MSAYDASTTEGRALLTLEVGQKVLNSILAGQFLGHSTVQGQRHYVHTDDPMVNIVTAFGTGDLAKAYEQLDRATDGGAMAMSRHMLERAFAPFAEALKPLAAESPEKRRTA